MHTVTDEREIGRDRESRPGLGLRIGLHALSVAVAQLDAQPGFPQDAVVSDRRYVVRHLNWRGEEEALTDREVRRVSRVPCLIGGIGEMLLLPVRAWHEPLGLEDEVDVRRLAETEALRGVREAVRIAVV